MTTDTNQSKQRPITVYLVLAGGVLALSFAAIFIRSAQTEGVPSLVIAASRLLIAALLLTPFTLQGHRPALGGLSRRGWGLLVASGVFLAMHFAFWVSSLEYTSVLISVTLVTTTPIWTALLELFVLKTRLRLTLIVGLIIALVGGVMIGIETGAAVETPSGSNLLLGAALSLAGAVTVAVYLTIGRKMREGLALLPYIWVVYGTAGLALAGVLVAMRIPVLGYSWQGYAYLLALGTIPQLIGHTTMNYAVKYVSATYVSIATKLEPIGSAILAFYLFSEVPNQWQIIGSGVILVGVVIASLQPRARRVDKVEPVEAAPVEAAPDKH